jgi:hypothetical protein
MPVDGSVLQGEKWSVFADSNHVLADGSVAVSRDHARR